MATVNALHTVSIEAAGDLSAEQYTFGVVDSAGQVAQQTTAGGDADGVIMNKPEAQGDPTEFAIGGVAKVVAGATVAAGAKVQSDTTGRGITAATGDHVLGKALTGGDVNEVIEVLLVSKHILA